MAFTAKDVKELREKTGVGMMECKKALTEADGDMEKAVEILRERGLASSAKKSSRVAAEGLVVTLVDKAAGVAAMVEVNCETDFVAGNPEFKALCSDIAKTVIEARPADLEALLASKLSGSEMTVEEAKQELFLKVRENMNVRRFTLVEGTVCDYIHMGGSVGVLVSFNAENPDSDEFAEMGKNVAMQIAAMKPEYLSSEDITAEELEKMRTITIESALNKPDSLPKPILNGLIAKAISDKAWSDEDIAAYEEQKNNKFWVNFVSKEAMAALAAIAVASKEEIIADPKFGNVFAKVVDGRIAKQIKETCLLQQEFVRSDLFEGNVGGYIASVAKKIGAVCCTGFQVFVRGEGIEKKKEDFAAEIASMIS